VRQDPVCCAGARAGAAQPVRGVGGAWPAPGGGGVLAACCRPRPTRGLHSQASRHCARQAAQKKGWKVTRIWIYPLVLVVAFFHCARQAAQKKDGKVMRTWNYPIVLVDAYFHRARGKLHRKRRHSGAYCLPFAIARGKCAEKRRESDAYVRGRSSERESGTHLTSTSPALLMIMPSHFKRKIQFLAGSVSLCEEKMTWSEWN